MGRRRGRAERLDDPRRSRDRGHPHRRGRRADRGRPVPPGPVRILRLRGPRRGRADQDQRRLSPHHGPAQRRLCRDDPALAQHGGGGLVRRRLHGRGRVHHRLLPHRGNGRAARLDRQGQRHLGQRHRQPRVRARGRVARDPAVRLPGHVRRVRRRRRPRRHRLERPVGHHGPAPLRPDRQHAAVPAHPQLRHGHRRGVHDLARRTSRSGRRSRTTPTRTRSRHRAGLLNTYPHGSSPTPRGVVVKNGSVYVAHSGTNTVGASRPRAPSSATS
jgi:hypothetical protein